jgi:exodeoxyribonuclease-1
MTPSFLWHDYETFGVNTRHDRPAQFAGIRTDRDLNEIGSPVSIYCQPTADYLPDPQSVVLTGITPRFCEQNGLPEYQFAQQIMALLGQAHTIGVGYNTLRFDDEVTRFLFWRNLMEPYSREWQNGCGRWDILDLVRTCYALRPEGMEWPLNEKGQVSFKLENLTRANGLTHEQAHDALSDVRATIALARLIKTQQTRLWHFALALHKKEAVLAQMGMRQAFWHVSGMYPVERGCLALVFPLAFHPRNKNELIVWDLASDPRELEDLDAPSIRERLFTKTENLPAGVLRLPIKTIHLNRSPMVIGQIKTVTPAIAARWGLHIDQALAHAHWLESRVPLWQDRWPQVYEPTQTRETMDADVALYDGFLSADDRQQLERLRLCPPEQWADKTRVFEDVRIPTLLFRYRARHFPHTLNEMEQHSWLLHCQARWQEGPKPAPEPDQAQSGPLNEARFIQKIQALRQSVDARQGAWLDDLETWAQERRPSLVPSLAPSFTGDLA